jgi:penicillin amidase
MIRRRFLFGWVIVLAVGPAWPEAGKVELIRDRWGVPHAFAEREADGFFAVGWACAEDRLLQMELLRRRATGRLAEVFGAAWVDSDRKFRIGGIARYCAQAFDNLPKDMQDDLRAYAAGVNAWAAANPDRVRRRLAKVGQVDNLSYSPWTPSDCLAAWMGVAEVFDPFISEGAITFYRDFQQLVAEVSEAEALQRRGMVIDDAAAVVPESEMAKDKAVYARLKAMKHTPAYFLRSADREPLHFSHAWAVDGARSTTGKPILESDPQTSVNNPALWYEFHLCAGRYDVRGIGVAGCPAMLIGWNRRVAWGATALGAGCDLTFLDKLSDDGRGYLFRGKTEPFNRRLERIEVKDGPPVIQEVLTNRHGFVFNSLARQNRAGEAYVSYYKMAHDKGSSVRAMLLWMRTANWTDFRAAMEHYYSPGLHIVYADVEGNLGYQTLAHMPLTKRTRRMAIEGWTGENEVAGRIPLAEMPHMFNPDAHFISHANNLPVGSWYPHDLGLATGGIGDTARSMRLRQLLAGDRKFSVGDFEAVVHRDDVDAVVSALLPAARKVAEEDKVNDPNVARALSALKEWDGHYNAVSPAYSTAMALAGAKIGAFRGSALGPMLGGGEGGICHFARLVGARFARDGATPKDAAAREYLIAWLRMGGGGAAPARMMQRPTERAAGRPMGPARPTSPTRPTGPTRRTGTTGEVQAMPYQVNGPLRFPSVDSELDLVSPPLVCGNGSTIWSQKGNSYTQIIDLADVDNSRSVLPPGISEDAESAFHADQIPIWVKGTTHPAPLSRARVEALASSRATLGVKPYDGPSSSGERLASSPREPGARFIPAIPQAAPERSAAGGASPEPLPGRKPDDPKLETALRYLINPDRTAGDLDSKIAELRDTIKGNGDLTRQMIGGLRLVLSLNYGTDEARVKMRAFLNELGGELPPARPTNKSTQNR